VSVAAKRQLKKITTFEFFIGSRVSKHYTPHVPESRALSIRHAHRKSNTVVTFADSRRGDQYCRTELYVHRAVIHVYDEAGNVIETHKHTGGLKGDFVTRLGKRHART